MKSCINIKSGFSFLKSSIKIHEVIQKAKEYGYDSLALSDLDNMHGILSFYRECKKQKITGILGVTIPIESKYVEGAMISLYALDTKGYRNLLKISSYSQIKDGSLSLEEIAKYKDSIVFISPGYDGEIEKMILNDHPDTNTRVQEYQDLLGEKFYFGLYKSEESYVDYIYPKIKSYSNIEKIPFDKVLYLEKDDEIIYMTLKAINDSNHINHETFQQSNHFYLKKPEEVEGIYSDEELNNLSVFSNVTYDIKLDEYRMPKYPLEDKMTSSVYLEQVAASNLEKMMAGDKKQIIQYKKRLYDELKIIDDMGFSDYFLIVWDFVKYAKEHSILVGPGRGSAAGSLVAYVLGITEVDPIKYDLLFERFLNPERISMPDIDLDFPDNRRDEVIEYVKNKYGKDKVAYIVAFGTFAARSAIRDTAKVLQIDDLILDEVLKYVPTNGSDINRIISGEKGLKQLITMNPDAKALLNIASRIESLPRHTTTHAAGIIINDHKLVNYTPLQNGLTNMYQTQYEASDLEKIGLLKIDFLGLRNLSMIQQIVDYLSEEDKVKIDITNIPLDDKPTLDLLSKGDTNGIFQLESKGMRNLLINMGVESFDDIVAALALYRPGPMENIPEFIKRKKGQSKVDYPHNNLTKILEPTNGIIVYQEQIMRIANEFAGYTLGEADILRRAVSKKDKKTLDTERARFVQKCTDKNYSKEVANEIYDYIVRFADYGFNKSHSVAYSLISYQLAYLKANYPSAFMRTLLTSVIGSEGQISKYVKNVMKTGMKVLNPSVNQSDLIFSSEDGNLRFPLLSIKNVGRVAARNIIDEREANGLFKDFKDFVLRTKSQVSKRVVEYLVFAGAMDEFKVSKKGMISKIDDILNLADLGGFIDKSKFLISYPKDEYDFDTMSMNERDAIGLNLKYHPVLNFDSYIGKHNLVRVSDISEDHEGEKIRLFGMVSQLRTIKTKDNKSMGFVTVEDNIDQIEGVLFPSVYAEYNKILEKGTLVVMLAKVEKRNDKIQLNIEKVYKVK